MASRDRPLLLDLFCGAGGIAVGYSRAGFQVVGVDVAAQPRYPFRFVQADALEFLDAGGAKGFCVVHASPPCELYSVTHKRHAATEHPDLIGPVRERLAALGRVPYLIENVIGAPLVRPVQLCGSYFPPRALRRHRLFESNYRLLGTPCLHHLQERAAYAPSRSGRRKPAEVISVYGAGGAGPGQPPRELRRWAMGIEWMTNAELAEAIPPSYGLYLGKQLLTIVRRTMQSDGAFAG